jgi:cold shock CspA family protein
VVERKTGSVLKYIPARGFGFIETAGGNEIFFHISSWAEPDVDPRPGQRVTYIETSGRDGRPIATQVIYEG